MKHFNNATASVGQKIVATVSAVQTSVSKSYIISVEPGLELPLAVQYVSHLRQVLATMRVAVDDAEMESFVTAAGRVVEVVELPNVPSARTALLAWSVS